MPEHGVANFKVSAIANVLGQSLTCAPESRLLCCVRFAQLGLAAIRRQLAGLDPENAIAGRLAGVGPSASLVAIENKTGEVKAMVGGSNFAKHLKYADRRSAPVAINKPTEAEQAGENAA